jgi:transcriptional regulator with GAF, ATPase, and Fis domain
VNAPHRTWRLARLESLLDFSLALAGPRGEAEVVEELVQRAVGLLDAARGVAVAVSPALEPVRTANVAWPLALPAAAQFLTAPELNRLRGGEPVRLRGGVAGLVFDELLAAACLWRDELFGVVAVADKEARGGRASFDEEDATLLRSLALLAAPAIASARELEEARRRRELLEEENRTLRAEVTGEEGLIGESAAMRTVLERVLRVAPTDVTVLLRGESGTGKERVARLLHSLSARASGPFVALNCAAVPETLLEAELFGIERGVATGVAARVGKLELANGGALFLDEVGDLSPALQAKLLRVVQEREVERVGGRQTVRVDVRLVTATNRDLEAMLASGEFRSDLYYRLRVVEITLPPLRQRREDIPLLAHHFVQRHARKLGKGPVALTRSALEVLLRHDFPGNVRELENLLEAVVALSQDNRLSADDVQLALGATRQAAVASDRLEDVVRSHVLQTLARCHGQRSRAARELGIDRTTLYRMLMRWNATPDADRNNAAPTARRKRSDRTWRP